MSAHKTDLAHLKAIWYNNA